MTNLLQASRELFHRPEDERFASLVDLQRHCLNQKERSRRIKEPGSDFQPVCDDGQLALKIDGHPPHRLNDVTVHTPD